MNVVLGLILVVSAGLLGGVAGGAIKERDYLPGFGLAFVAVIGALLGLFLIGGLIRAV